MEKVSFRLVAAVKVMDAITRKLVTDARIVSCHGFRRINKENGVIILVDDGAIPDTGEKEIFVDSPYYQGTVIRLSEKDQGSLKKIWLVPGPRKGLPDQAAVIRGRTEPNAVVSCEFRENESGLRIIGEISEKEICLATVGCAEPEGGQFLISDGAKSSRIIISKKSEEEEGSFRYEYTAAGPLPEMDAKKIRLYPIVTVLSGEDGTYYLPVCQKMKEDGWPAVLTFSANGKVREKEITVRPGMRTEEDCLKI